MSDPGRAFLLLVLGLVVIGVWPWWRGPVRPAGRRRGKVTWF